MMFDKIKSFIPQSWISMVTVKGERISEILNYDRTTKKLYFSLVAHFAWTAYETGCAQCTPQTVIKNDPLIDQMSLSWS